MNKDRTIAVVRDCIDELRQQRRLTFDEIGALADASGRTAERWYHGEREPRFFQALKLLEEAGWRIIDDEVVKGPQDAPQVLEVGQEWRKRALRAERLLDHFLSEAERNAGMPSSRAAVPLERRQHMSAVTARWSLEREVEAALNKLEEVAVDLLPEHETPQDLTG